MHVFARIAKEYAKSYDLQGHSRAIMEERVFVGKGVFMNQSDWRQQNENVRVAMGELAFLCGWVMNYPQMAGQLAIEAHELARRYVESPTLDLEFRAVIPEAVWKQFQTACTIAETTFLNEQACYDKLQDILFRGMQDFIMLHKQGD